MMMKAKEEERARARELRTRGWSLKKIARELSISQSSASNWVRDIELTPEQRRVLLLRDGNGADGFTLRRAREKRAEAYRLRREKWREQGREQARRREWLHVAGCMLYWAEGKKAGGCLVFANSDPCMISLFAKFIRHYFDVEDSNWAIRCSLKHTEKYWIERLGLPDTRLRKFTPDTRPKTGRKKRILEYGLCYVTIHRLDILEHIRGAIVEYGTVA
jgi:hypothetical protein